MFHCSVRLMCGVWWAVLRQEYWCIEKIRLPNGSIFKCVKCNQNARLNDATGSLFREIELPFKLWTTDQHKTYLLLRLCFQCKYKFLIQKKKIISVNLFDDNVALTLIATCWLDACSINSRRNIWTLSRINALSNIFTHSWHHQAKFHFKIYNSKMPCICDFNRLLCIPHTQKTVLFIQAEILLASVRNLCCSKSAAH